MKDWSVTHVGQWLERNGLDSEVREQFRREKITGKALQYMTKSELSELSAVALGDRIVIFRERDQYLANPDSSYREEQTVDVSLSPGQATSPGQISTVSRPPPEKLETAEKVLATEESAATVFIAQDVPENVPKSKEVDSEKLSSSSLDKKEDFCASETKEDIKSKQSILVSESKEVLNTKSKKETHVSKPNEAVDVSESEEDILTKFQKPSEVLRTFGNPPDSSFKYKKGAKLSCIETRSGGNLLQPIHRFVRLDLDTITGKDFANEAVSFVCACLNDRANGTIHFGIVPEASSGGTVHGQITGVVLKKKIEHYADFLKKAFKNCFDEHQQEILQKCVCPAVFIEVFSETEVSEFVIEIDVIPEYIMCKDEAFSARLCKAEKNAYEDYAIFQIVHGNVSQLTMLQQNHYMEYKQDLATERKKQEEDAARKKLKPRDELSKKFLHLLCDGDETFRGDQYRILVINKPDEAMDSDTMKETFSFLADLEWKVIFDFDAEAKICNFLQEEENVMKIVMSDEFSRHSESNVNKKDHLKQTQEDIRNSVQPTWIFVNGYSPLNDEPLSPRNWKMRKSDGFKEAVRFIGHQIPEGRALVVFLLLSKDTDVVLEAAEEFITWFPDQWLCVAEEESIGKPWIEELQRRNCIDSGNDRVVFGMRWSSVQDAVARIACSRRRNCCEIPTSAGSFVVLRNKAINELNDLEILGSFECDNSDIRNDADKLRLHEAAQKQTFFQGNGVSWWNFWFPGQVCERDVLRRLRKVVESSLDGVDDDVGKVVLSHQPGAGGTTVAKHLLWELRKSYRCGIVQTINDGQTANHILTLYQYEDNNPKPVLLLLDNPDEEKVNLLIADVSEKAKNLTRKGEDQAKCVCVFLICLRQSKVASQYDQKHLVLKHQLTLKEQNWFKDMHKMLLVEHKREPSIFTDPQLLISFNILKENFNKEFIQRMVKSFLDNITDEKERRLLKYISLINAFDLECRALPTAAFDAIMIENPFAKKSHRWGKKAYCSRWETHLSSDFRVLVNEASKPSIGYIHALRVINQLLSKEILSALRDLGNSRVPISDIALEFFSCTDIFYAASKARDDLLEISKDILKRRGHLPNGKPETRFAPLIQTIVNDETTEKASEILEEGLKLTSDPFIAQQMARLFITVQNWQQAIKYAEMATEQKPDNSYLWDTLGRIYEGQLLEQYNKLLVGSRSPSAEEFVPIIKIALNGMEMFTKVQQTSQYEKNVSVNQAGFFGELQMIVCLLDCLTYLFQDKDKLRHFILEKEYIPEECNSLVCYEGTNYITKLKELNIQVQIAVNRLEDELFQLKEEVINEFRRNHVRYQSDSLLRLKENLDSYFGEDGDNVPESLEEREKCEFRRRRILRLAGFNLRSIFDLRWKSDGSKKLQRIQEMAKQNVFSEHVAVTDYQTLISVTLALTSMDPDYLSNFNEYNSLVKWSKKLYELRDTSFVSRLEPYLFYVMFNWPRENTNVSPKVIESAIKNWKDAYYLKYPRQKDEGKPYRKRDTTMFFLAKGRDMESIYTFFEEIGSRRNDTRVRSDFWRQPVTVKKLQRFSGVLSNGGNDVRVQLQYGQGNKAHISIPTSFPIRERQMWNKQVYFVIGLSWIGPKAFDITLDDPRITTELSSDAVSSKTVHNKEFHRSGRNVVEVTEEEFRRQLKVIDEKLDEIQKLKDKKRRTVGLDTRQVR